MLREAEISGPATQLKTYFKLSGPGWLQSAITLGGGSLGGSLFLGVLAGYSLLWLQPLAMILGVIMLSAISHVALSTGQSPFKAINEEINPVLGWGWAIATIAANIVWCLPQFALGTAAATKNLFPALDTTWGKAIVCAGLLGSAIAAIIAYERGASGVKTFDRVLKVMVAFIVLAFFGVVIKLGINGSLPTQEILAGFIPDLSLLTEPSEKYDAALAATGEYRDFWKPGWPWWWLGRKRTRCGRNEWIWRRRWFRWELWDWKYRWRCRLERRWRWPWRLQPALLQRSE